MTAIDGATLMARCLKQQGVDYMFGIVGFPVQPIAAAAQREGIQFFGMRNEQAASYAAQAAGYLTGRPQACLVVSGPGVVHALAGLSNAQQNCWPMILIGGASPVYQNGMGSFQEAPQVKYADPYCKYAHAVEQVDRIPFYVEQAVRYSIYGRPGPVYLDMPDDIITGQTELEDVEMKRTVPPPPRLQAIQEDVDAAISALKSAERPLVIVGKGMAWSRAEAEVQEFVERTQLPYLATPMGKGVIPDDHPLSVGAARTFALQNADLVLLLGARLNWILHYGLPPRFAKDVRVVQLDINAEEMGNNVPAEVALVGDGKAVMRQINTVLEQSPWQYPPETTWRSGIASKIAANAETSAQMAADNSSPMNYYYALNVLKDIMPRDAILASEGANTMDIGRQVLPNYLPRTRLDAGTYGTMGVGLGFAIGAAVSNPGRRIVCLEGDSAFGFSGMEIETACRYQLPITFVILNNNGIGGGPTEIDRSKPLPPNSYTPRARYEKMAECFGGRGYYVDQADDLPGVLKQAMNDPMPTIVNVELNTRANRKPQEFRWRT